LKKADPDEELARAKLMDNQANLEALKKKQEIMAKYNQVSQENKPDDDGTFRFSMVKGNNSALVKKVLLARPWWQEIE
jgi:hypothetical protein